MRESFVFYRSFFEALEVLNNEQRGKCYAALAAYALNGVVPDDSDPVVKMFFAMARAQIDANNQRYENGRKGGRPKNQTETKTKPNNNQTMTEEQPKATQSKTEVEPNVNVNVNVNVKEKDTLKGVQKEKPQFIPPTLAEVQKYISDKGLFVDGKKFIDYFEAGRWRDSEGKPVKNWKQKLITWDSKGRTERTLQAAKSFFPKTTGVKSATYGEDIPL